MTYSPSQRFAAAMLAQGSRLDILPARTPGELARLDRIADGRPIEDRPDWPRHPRAHCPTAELGL